jgi:hypothetical protein
MGYPMYWLFYSSDINKLSREIEAHFQKLFGIRSMNVQYGLEKLDGFLSRPHKSITHAVLMVSALNDLNTLTRYQDQIWNWCTIIGIPEARRDKMMPSALEFHPRFVAMLPEDTGHFWAVVEKMIQNVRKRSIGISVKRRGRQN